MLVVSRCALPGLAALFFLDQRPRAAECHIRLKMNLIAAILVGLLVVTAGCSSQPRAAKPGPGKEHAILTTLSTRNRNAVHVALWTLEQNGILLAEKVSFGSSYTEAWPGIEAIRQYVRTLPDDKLGDLDRSLA